MGKNDKKMRMPLLKQNLNTADTAKMPLQLLIILSSNLNLLSHIAKRQSLIHILVISYVLLKI